MANDRFDGERFVGIDSEAIGDGQGGSTQPEDTWLENMADSRARAMWRVGESCGWSPLQGIELAHRYATYHSGIIGWGMITLDPSCAGVTLTLKGRQGIRTAISPEMTYRLRIQGLGPDAPELTQTLTVSGTQLEDELVFDFPQVPSRTQSAWVWLEIESTADTSNPVIDPKDVLTGVPFVAPGVLGVAWYWDVADASPGPDLAIMGFYRGAKVEDEDVFEPIYATEGSSDYEVWALDPNINSRVVDDPNAGLTPDLPFIGDVGVVALSWCELETVILHVRYDETKSGRNWTPKRPEEMLANDTVEGRNVTKHPDNLDAVHGRERLKSWGLTGERYTVQSSTESLHKWKDEPAAWMHVEGLAASEGWALLDQKTVRIDKNLADLYVHLFPVSVVFRGDDHTYESFSEVQANRVDAEWDLRVTLEQFDPANPRGWANATQLAQQQVDLSEGIGGSAEAWPAGVRDVVPFLLQSFLSKIEDTADDYSKTLREGVLYQDGGDTSIVQPTTVRLDLSPLDDDKAVRDAPCRLRIEASLFGVDSNFTVDDFRLYLVGQAQIETSEAAPL